MSDKTSTNGHGGHGHSSAHGTANTAGPHPDGVKLLTPEMVAAIQAYFPRYPSRQAVTLPALHIVNEKLRCVPLQAVVEVAELLELPPAVVQDTLSFYGYFHQAAPHGMTRAMVCRSVSCALRGADSLLEHMCSKAGVHPGGTTADGSLTLEFAECLGACEQAPCILANSTLHGCVTPESAEGLIATWKQTPAASPTESHHARV